jgi:hypothetical protein
MGMAKDQGAGTEEKVEVLSAVDIANAAAFGRVDDKINLGREAVSGK